jgi:hypothetical protein
MTAQKRQRERVKNFDGLAKYEAQKNEEIGYRLLQFEGADIRRIFHQNEWWYVVVDVVLALTESANPTDYIKKMRKRDPELGKGWGQFVPTLPVWTPGHSEPQLRDSFWHSSYRTIDLVAKSRTV